MEVMGHSAPTQKRVRMALSLLAAVALAITVAGEPPASGAQAVRTRPPKAVLVAKDFLPSLTDVVSAPGEPNHLYLVGRAGVVRVLDRGKLSSRPFLDISARVNTSASGESGFMSIAFDPSYSINHYVYACYNDPQLAITIARYTVKGGVADPQSEDVLLRIEHPGSDHFGGQLQFGPDGKLYAATGDGADVATNPLTRSTPPDAQRNGQNPQVLMSKVFRLDLSAANPAPEIVAYGLREPWRFSFAPNGRLVIGDVGEYGNEEIDIIPRDAPLLNFGWSTYEGKKLVHGGSPLNPAGTLTFPAYSYATHVGGNCAVMGGYVYRGKLSSLRGRYVFGDYCSGRVWSAKLNGTRVSSVRTLPFRIPKLTTFGESAAGELYAGTASGRLYHITS